MSQADLDINRNVRKILVKHFIDLGCLSLRSSNGRVTIRGELMRIFGVAEKLSPPIVETIFGDIKRISGVKHIDIELENWTNEGGRWHQRKTETKSDHQAVQQLDYQDYKSYDLDADMPKP